MSSVSSILQQGRVLPALVFDQIAFALRTQAVDSSTAVTVISEVNLSGLQLHPDLERFLIVVSARFSGLLLAQSVVPNPNPAITSDQVATQALVETPAHYRTAISFALSDIAMVLDLLQQPQFDGHLAPLVALAHQHLRPNDSQLQAQFTLQLAEIMLQQTNSLVGNSCPIELPLSDAALKKTAQDKVFSQVANQIRQSQELPQILSTAVRQVCSFLNADRVVIYELENTVIDTETGALKPPLAVTPEALSLNPSQQVKYGHIAYEARSNPSIPTILNLSNGMQCFIDIEDCKEKYQQGSIQAVEDIRKTYANAPCLVELLEQAKVRAKLIVPIVTQEHLWGLLIIHQCFETRVWLEGEIHFLKCIAELLAIAIRQSYLYVQLQQETQNLEKRVIDRTQELRDALQASQTANLAKTEFLASVSHELRTPLTAIIGMATTLLRLPQDPKQERSLSLEKQRDYLKIIRNSGEHLLELINDILDLSQVEAGRAILEIQEFSITQVINESLRMLRNKAQQNGVFLELDLQILVDKNNQANKRSPVVNNLVSDSDRFLADARRVKQILLNLLSNAIKFTPEGGTVTLRVWRERDCVVFEVQDTGIGIPEHQFPLLFKKFQQLDTSYHRQYEGTGLGLALTKQLVDLHGGWIEVKSTVDLGSIFTVKLPNQPPPLRKKGASTNALEQGTTVAGRIVLIEHQEHHANLICDLLTSAGHQVIWMVDGMTALQQIELLKPDMLIMNTQLPRISAADFLQCLRQTPAIAKIQVLNLINKDLAESDRGQVNGADDCLEIPLTYPEELLDKVTTLIERFRSETIQ